MKVKLDITLDIDAQAYAARFLDPIETAADDRRLDSIVRDDVQGLAAAAVVGWFNTCAAGILTDYHVPVWDAEGAQAPV